MIIYDFYSGTGSSTKAFEEAGHTIINVELDEYFQAHERDILTLTPEYLIAKYGQPDFIWASPPCQKFSVASLWKYWEGTKGASRPKHPAVYEAIALVEHTVKLMQDLKPTYGWLMENPRGMLRHQEVVKELPRYTITYCQYGDTRMKPTDLWGTIQGWTPRAMCKPRMDCHESSPAGTNAGGTGKLRNARLRSMIPYELGKEICDLINISHNEISL
jgi:site-specific DNA-cytosine methylase